eukprot:TRINITY_DN3286_c0_g2_i1.p1 TRINITY_DN3286_c0_g2~~TRINITY_DN3286_c0_g2_i1.p1  ORF type:complete len:159 (+),score=34.17 TRINITY_DN3286_c0_g2_i1:233-709(+)
MGIRKKRFKEMELEIYDYKNCVIMPGLIDIAVHFQEPSRDIWEGYFQGTKAACAGGVTTVFDMPMVGEPYNCDSQSFEERKKAAEQRLWVDCGFLGCIQGSQYEKLKSLCDAGVFGLVFNYGTQQIYGIEPVSPCNFNELIEKLQITGIDLSLIHILR